MGAAMKSQRVVLLALALVLAATGSAFAHGGRARIGVGVYMGPYWSPWFYPPPYYYPPQVIVVPQAPPPVYIEQREAPAAPEPASWYYCHPAKAYYPYVKECPEAWQKVLPQPER